MTVMDVDNRSLYRWIRSRWLAWSEYHQLLGEVNRVSHELSSKLIDGSGVNNDCGTMTAP